ncbi:hypothetical protein niasHT_039786 [Heterodera trifolii]|uniref:Non-specific serine/threonine protein kinase n=1 Tax=Heterodera trifolii TaxID=157864 RepID=A0ABD2IMK0_9BILA
MSSTDKFLSITQRIDIQESRIQQRDYQQLKALNEQLSQRESEMRELISQEKARNQLQQLEIERLQNQLEESTNTIRRVQEELEIARKTANGVLWELEESELAPKSEAEIGELKNRITVLETRLKKKKVEMELLQETMKGQTEVFHREILELKAEKRVKEAEIAEMREKLRTSEANGQKREYLDQLNQKLGSLDTKNESLRDEVGTLKKGNKEMEQRYKQCEDEKAALRQEINSLLKQISASSGSSDIVSSRLMDEIERLKQQKAQLRCEHVQLKRKYTELETESVKFGGLTKEMKLLNSTVGELRSKIESAESEKEAIENENERLKERQKKMESEMKEKIDKMQRLCHENEECENSRLKLLQSELDLQRRKCDGMKRSMGELDMQCEKLMTQLRLTDAEKRKAQNENEMLKREIEKLSGQLTEKIKMENENASLKDRSKWLKDKIVFLESELKETSTDHRTELANLADQLGATSTGTSKGKESENSGEVPKMEAKLRQQEAELRSLQRKLEQYERENNSQREEMEKMREEATKTKQENIILRQNFDVCLKKAETFKSELDALKEANDQLKSENEREKNSISDQLYELRADLEQKEKLIAYLQSVVQPKQMQKLPRHRSSLLSDGSDLSEMEMEYKQCLQLEKKRNQLKNNLENRRRVLDEKQNEMTPTRPMLREETICFHESLSPARNSQSKLKNSSTDSAHSALRFPGRMRHDIPHRWKRHFVTVATNKCQVCMDGLPHFRLVLRCRDCSLTVHPHCRTNVVNTCGLPKECANFYLDTHSISSERMTGWVKLWRFSSASAALPSSEQSAHWLNAWAVIDDNRLSFYDSDQLAISEGALPFLSIDLDRDHWRIYNQTTDKPLDGIRGTEMSMLIELKLPDYILFLLAPTVQAKQRWVYSLQMATSRRVFVQRRRASTIVTNSLLLALDKPLDLSINSTVILRDEWLLLGAQEGLFATPMSPQQLRAPFRIAGVSCVYWMELLPEFDMLLAICGSARQLAVIHLQQLLRAFKVAQQPTVSCTNIANIEQCHIAVVSNSEHHRDKRFVYIATIDEIVVLQYVAKLGFFSPVAQIKTEEPCTCICSASFGFVFGADNFHFARFDDNFAMPSPLVVENCPFDFPVAAVEISDNEFLLAFHNFGLFVNSQGKRSRSKNIEWEKVPLEFVYASPHLYIVYCEFLEVVRVAPYIGPDSSTITDDRSLFKCRAAHRTGNGLNAGELLFTVSSEDRVELHIFGHADAAQQQQHQQSVKSILKRKMIETPAHNSSVSKRKN